MDLRSDPLHVRAQTAARLAEAEAHRRAARLTRTRPSRSREVVERVRTRWRRRMRTPGRHSAITSLAGGRNPS